MQSSQEEIYSSNPEDFEILKPIGYGSSATVHLGIYKPKNAKVAIKIIDMDAFERNQIDELRRETQVMFLCKHPNLLPVYCSYVIDSKLHIVTPYLAAGSCLDLLKHGYSEGLEEIYLASILKQALLGLEYLHKNGHIHRDLKAGNLLIDQSGAVLLADFGVSSTLNDHFDRKKLRKTFVGTPCWMAPEVMEQAGYDSKADIWSFGITALELANGQAPLAKFPPIKVLMMTLSKDPPTLERDKTKYKYTRAFKEMIDVCLNKDPAKRPTVEKLLQHSFFKQVKKIMGISSLINSMPAIEDRATKPKIAQSVKLPAKGESWNFTPSSEHEEKSSYFDQHPIPEETARPTSPLPHLIETISSPVSNPTLAVDTTCQSSLSPARPDSVKKSRFVLDKLSIETNAIPESPTTLSEIKKGRFSVADTSETPSSANFGDNFDFVGQLPLTREASKSSRFSVSSDAGNISPVESIGANLQPSLSISKRGRFQLSNENGDPTTVSSTPENNSETLDHSNTLIMHANQLDIISRQNETQRRLLIDLHSTLNSGKVHASQLSSLGNSLNEQGKLNGKSENTLSDSLITFQQLTQQILQENLQLRQDNEQIRYELERLKISASPKPEGLELPQSNT